jgi:hypothetical protein
MSSHSTDIFCPFSFTFTWAWHNLPSHGAAGRLPGSYTQNFTAIKYHCCDKEIAGERSANCYINPNNPWN